MDETHPISRVLSHENTTAGAEEYQSARYTAEVVPQASSTGEDEPSSSYVAPATQHLATVEAVSEDWSDWSGLDISKTQNLDPNTGREASESGRSVPTLIIAGDERSASTSKLQPSPNRGPSITVDFEIEERPFDDHTRSLTPRQSQHRKHKTSLTDSEEEQGVVLGEYSSTASQQDIPPDGDQRDSLYDLSLYASDLSRNGEASDDDSVGDSNALSEAGISLPASVVFSHVSSLERTVESRLSLPAGKPLEHLPNLHQHQRVQSAEDDDRYPGSAEVPTRNPPRLPPPPDSNDQESIEPLRKRTSSWKKYLVPAAFKARRRRTRTSSPPPRRAPTPKPTFADVEAYRSSVKELAPRFKTFENVALRDTRHAGGCRIVYYDLLYGQEDSEPMRREVVEHRNLQPSYPKFRSQLRGVTDDCLQRIILVEDLSPLLINMLGATFQIPPHVFEQHLDRSGYSKKIESRDNKVAWQARSSAQGYSSITWYRPVLPLIPLTTRIRENLLSGQRTKVRCPVEACDDDDHYISTVANIWRNRLDLCPDPGLYHKQSKTEYPVGWEEKATTWIHDFDGCVFLIILLDPLPVVAFEGKEAQERPASNVGPNYLSPHNRRPEQKRTVSNDRKHQNVSDWIKDSTFEPPVSNATVPPPPPPPLPPTTRHEQNFGNFEPAPHTRPRLPPHSLHVGQLAEEPRNLDKPTATVKSGPIDQPYPQATHSSHRVLMIEGPSQVTEHVVSGSAQGADSSTTPPREPVIETELDKVTHTSDSRLLVDGTDELGRISERSPPRPHSPNSPKRPNVRFVDPLRSQTPVRSEATPSYRKREEVPAYQTREAAPSYQIGGGAPSYQTREEVPRFEGRVQYEAIHEQLVLFESMRARASSTVWGQGTFDSRHVHKYIKSQRTPQSTLEEFEYFRRLPRRRGNMHYDPLQALFRAMHDDTNSLIEIIRTSLQTIRKGTLDEDLMQKRVKFWRGLMHELNFSLGVLEAELREFEQFAKEAFVMRPGSSCAHLAQATRQALRGCLSLVDSSSQSLLAEMQIADSRRGIIETESVSKLTELAFVFIPLSFCASLFSMQIHELDGGVPVYVFILVAIGFVLMAYIVRLTIRSSRLIEYKIETMNRIREESYLQHDESVPTHVAMAWFGHAARASISKNLASFVAILAPGVVLLAVLAAIISPIIFLWQRQIDSGFSAVITVLVLSFDAVLFVPIFIELKDAGSIRFDPRDRLRSIQQYFEDNRRKKEKAKKNRKRKANGDLEALAEESTASSANQSHWHSSRR
ncbi:hypothetical protein E8E13_003855 [Curvularia kusanoi]|uniref:Uncharacterized protein n=1 Tax=Curvularia kusanoi TaxID=90978 RepID=A0A9P4W4L1_CURKU|nr:hypothetical protein E8E13_003855 [Curvularia kusanoi]